jgi:hypothetical protein
MNHFVATQGSPLLGIPHGPAHVSIECNPGAKHHNSKMHSNALAVHQLA